MEMSLDGIAVGRDRQTNTILFYNPLTKSYYRPQAWTLDETRLPVTHWPTLIKYDGSLHCGRYSNRTDPIPEPFPPGTRIQLMRDGKPLKGTIANVPIVSHPLLNTAAAPAADDDAVSPNSDDNSTYVVNMDDGTRDCDPCPPTPRVGNGSPLQLNNVTQVDSRVDCRI
jgi:hypothetical protein